uniref:C2H2-type domain-containing protein n=1 Tax=Timema bartmani TaxID=61472 RepID=A0A7R9EZC1_9NEOP|nr:unnamed protein product [Timema bartmani]
MTRSGFESQSDELRNKNEDSTCLPRLIESELTKPDTNDIEHPEENENNVSILSFVEVILDEGISHIGLNGREEIKTSDHSEREECLDVTKFSPSVSKRKRDRLKFRFQCNDCPKCYKFKYEIKNHAMKHTGERPFKCTFCDYKFRYSSHLTIHLKIHQGLRDFVCSECVSHSTGVGYLPKSAEKLMNPALFVLPPSSLLDTSAPAVTLALPSLLDRTAPTPPSPSGRRASHPPSPYRRQGNGGAAARIPAQQLYSPDQRMPLP